MYTCLAIILLHLTKFKLNNRRCKPPKKILGGIIMKKNFPNADEARKRSSESWKLVTLEEIQEKIITDLAFKDLEKVIVNDEKEYNKLKKNIEMQKFNVKIELQKDLNIFDKYDIEKQVEKDIQKEISKIEQ